MFPTMYYILGSDGHTPIEMSDFLTWGRWMETAERRVAKDQIGASMVSTVFLGLNHSYLDDGPPILFETMVFDGKLDGEMDRYCTWEEAEAGHKEMVARVSALHMPVPDAVAQEPPAASQESPSGDAGRRSAGGAGGSGR